MTIGELARACGVGVETIRYYERRRLLVDPRPRRVGFRDFSDDDVRRVAFVKQAQGLGFTLKEIAELLALQVSGATSCSDVRKLAEAKLADIDEKLRTLRSFKQALTRLMQQCARGGPRGPCAIVDALERGEAHGARRPRTTKGRTKR